MARPLAHIIGIIQWKGYRTLEAFLYPILIKHKITHPEWKLLGVVYEEGELQAAEIAAKLDVKAPLVTRTLKSLLRKKLIRIEAHTSDRRVKCVNMSAAGEKVLEKMEGDVQKMLGLIFRDVPPQHVRIYREVLEQIIVNGLALGKKPD